MAECGRWGFKLLVFFFAGSVVLLGAHSLQQHYAKNAGASEAEKVKKMIKEMHGDDMRASMAKEALSTQPRSEVSKNSYDKPGLGSGEGADGGAISGRNDLKDLVERYLPMGKSAADPGGADLDE
ncbi:MAG: hypothetical protein DCC75_07175 [Proteobacteria bacterium]|nr:MAG: hypothetical protein DCC75_07175 [Pseudomonadota bacterium]